jgi:hypothetical protein
MEDYRQCEECRETKALNQKYFPRQLGCTTSYQNICLKCKKAKKRKASLVKMENDALDKFSKSVLRGGSNIPHTAELLESIMNYFGGANGFSGLLMKQYFESPPGSRMRNSILEMVVRLASKNTEQGGAKKPIDLYSEEELESEIDKRLKQAVVTYGKVRYIDAQAQEAPNPHSATPGITDSSEHLGVPAGRTEDFAVRVEREADRSLKAIQADSEAEGVP